MKLSVLLTCILSVNLMASVYSQNARFDLDIKDQSVRDVLKTIEKESQFRFFYNEEFTDLDKKLTFSTTGQSIDGLMSLVLDNTEVSYKILDNNFIVITPKSLLQQNKVTGTVSDENGNPLPGVNVQIEGTTIGAISDIYGKYSIDKPNNNVVLVFSFVGYSTQKVTTTGKAAIDVKLIPTISKLDEVVVVGYGTQKKVNITGSVSNITSEALESRNVAKASLALSGALSGVSVRQSSGNPRTNEGAIIIRGAGTFSTAGSSPLVLVDGIASSLDRIEQNDIQTISVLKDAASAAIYGSQAANGVILIETKKGQAGAMKIDFTSYFGTQKATMLPVMVDSWTYCMAVNESLINMGTAPMYTEEEIQKYRAGTFPDHPNYDHIGTVWNSGKGLVSKYSLNMSGGTEISQYMFSVSYLNNQGIINNNNRQDYNMRLNLTSKIRDNLKLTVNLSGNQYSGRQPGNSSSTTDSGLASAQRATMRLNNTIIGKRDDGYYGHLETVHYGDIWSDSFFKDNSLYLYGTSGLEWKVFKDFTVTGKLGYTYNGYNSKDFKADYWISEIFHQFPNSLLDSWSKRNLLTVQSLVNYDKSFRDHMVNLLVGFEQNENISNNISAYRNQFPINELTEINVGSVTNDELNRLL